MSRSARGAATSKGRAPRWGIARVHGRSMLPLLRPGDRLLVDYRRPVRPDAVVVARLVDGTVAVKRATRRRTTRAGAAGWWLLSDNAAEGVDSRHRGVVPSTDVIAVAVARVWPRPRRL